MNSFDFSLYDSSDVSPPAKTKKSKELAKPTSEFDFDLYEAPIKPEKSTLDTLKGYGKTALKGSIEGISQLGRMFGPTIERPDILEKQSEALNELFPTDDTQGERSLRKSLQIAPSAIATPFGGPTQALVRSGIAGSLVEEVKELGGGEGLQTLAEISSFVGPDVFKKLVEKGKYAPLIKEARRLKMSDEEIAPLIQSDFKKKWLTNIAQKPGRGEEALKKTKSALDRTYEGMFQSEDATKALSSKDSSELLQTLGEIGKDLPVEARNRIAKDMLELVEKPITGQSMMNLWKDINYYFSKGEKQFGLFKEPLRKAISSISPQMEKDFKIVNDMYSKFFPLANRMRPGIVDKFVSAAESFGFLGSVFTWNYPAMAAMIGEKSARVLSREMLVNPRFQQLTKKMMIAVEENRVQLIKKTAEEMQKLVDSIVKQSPQESQKTSSETH